ncbi:Cthe_2314 family HEPN domain-containing protein [Paenibacillus xanthanilyticus]|uniref:Cthe_2314 family HEPN domain-containing protein n=1 Tax=Paenibacillus xanthanilyticus TaxID=1783531 RepID=A0ABV8KAL2_9BACL
MLRMMFGEKPRELQGELYETVRTMEQFAQTLHKRIAAGRDHDHKLRKYEVWTHGLIASLDELEQTHYAAKKFAELVKSDSLEAMSPAERLNYQRHVFFDKNGFIRLFAILDKMGNMLNDFLALETERIKPHFSYFTVLRNMRQRKLHPELSARLDELKEKHKEATNRLRRRRNVEIHHMNSEMQDDLKQNHEHYGEAHRIEDLKAQLADAQEGLDLATRSLRIMFEYAIRQMRKRSS